MKLFLKWRERNRIRREEKRGYTYAKGELKRSGYSPDTFLRLESESEDFRKGNDDFRRGIFKATLL